MLRFAFSPTSDMDISSLRVALFNYIIAQQKGEELIVRVQEMDKEKNIEAKEKETLEILGLFGISYSQLLYQSQNIRFHSAMALQLLHEKKAFSCFCSPAWLDNKREEAKEQNREYSYDDACRNLPAELVIDNENPFTIRIARADSAIVIHDMIEGERSFEADRVDSALIMTQEKTPLSYFASAVDDMLADISTIIRDESELNDTLKEEHIRASLEYNKRVEYAHLATISNEDNANLSIKELLQEGFLPEAITNYLIAIANKTPKEIFTLQEAIEWFSLESISKQPLKFNRDTLAHINREHLKNLDAKELSRYVGFADAEIGELARIYLNDVVTTKELKSKIAPIFSQRRAPQEFLEQTKLLKELIIKAPFFEEYEDFKEYLMQKSALEGEAFSVPLCILLTNAKECPDIAKAYKYLKNYLGEIIK